MTSTRDFTTREGEFSEAQLLWSGFDGACPVAPFNDDRLVCCILYVQHPGSGTVNCISLHNLIVFLFITVTVWRQEVEMSWCFQLIS